MRAATSLNGVFAVRTFGAYANAFGTSQTRETLYAIAAKDIKDISQINSLGGIE